MDASNHRTSESSPLPTLESPLDLLPPPVGTSTRPPKLLPAFEPFTSSPPATKKRSRPIESNDVHYPTPVPTSSTGILPSSPNQSRPNLPRTMSTISERAPLSDVPTFQIPFSGQKVFLGRSSSSCTFQLPYNRNISRVHVGVTYHQPTDLYASGRIEILCLGWNGCKIIYKGRSKELDRDENLFLNDPTAEIMLDILDTRVIISWPSRSKGLFGNSKSWLSSNLNDPFSSSPPTRHVRSPPLSPVRKGPSMLLSPASGASAVKVYEDPVSEDVIKSSPSKQLSARVNDENKPPQEYSENENEENEPLVHIMGSSGSNLLKRLQSVTTSSPERPNKRTKSNTEQEQQQDSVDGDYQESPLSSPPCILSKPTYTETSPSSINDENHHIVSTIKHPNESPIKNHVVNQLAFSRVHATPLSTIFSNLSDGIKAGSENGTTVDLTIGMLRGILKYTPGVGEIAREGKDAAGKVLENEYYYDPEHDINIERRDMVLASKGTTSIRSVRKSHKQYFWKKPRV